VFAADNHRVDWQKCRELLTDDPAARLSLRKAEHAMRS
jgi:hypothetical protein